MTISDSRGLIAEKAAKGVSPFGLLLSAFARLSVGGVLIYSGFSKAVAPSAEFAAALAQYHILPGGLLTAIAAVWPWLELLVGAYVFFGYFTRLFAGMAAGMFAIFLTVLVSAVVRGIDPGSCGCFGVGLSISLHKAIALDSGLIAFCLLLSALSKTPLPWSADSWINS